MPMTPVFLDDEALDYTRLATRLEPGARLEMDEAYRRAHLPLVAPDHRKIIAEDAARGYRMGLHELAWSLVIPLSWEKLSSSPSFRELDKAMRQGPIAGKIAWDSLEARRNVLHVTICGGLARGEAPQIPPEWSAAFNTIKPFRARISGLFSGNINLGRFYLKLYPEKRQGMNPVHELQQALGRPLTGLSVAGIYNLIDDLDEDGTSWLAGILARFEGRDILDFRVDKLWLLGCRDDLALQSEVAEIIRLG